MSRRSSSDGTAQGIPEATIARLPVYLRALYALAERCVASASSEELAAAAGVNSAKLRKDLSHLGTYGTRGVGYDVDYLIYQISRELGLTQDWPIAIAGAGNLGRALANYGGFLSRGFRVAAIFDSDPAVIGTLIAGQVVRGIEELDRLVSDHNIMIGAITVPASAAQATCDQMVAAGVTSILNFAPIVLSVPDGVDVRRVDLSIELQILAFHAQRKSTGIRGRSEVRSLAAHRRSGTSVPDSGGGTLRRQEARRGRAEASQAGAVRDALALDGRAAARAVGT